MKKNATVKGVVETHCTDEQTWLQHFEGSCQQ